MTLYIDNATSNIVIIVYTWTIFYQVEVFDCFGYGGLDIAEWKRSICFPDSGLIPASFTTYLTAVHLVTTDSPQTVQPTWNHDTWWQPTLHRLYDLLETMTLGDKRLSIDFTTYPTPWNLVTPDSPHTLRPTWHHDTWWQPTLHILYDLHYTNTLGDNRLSTYFMTYLTPIHLVTTDSLHTLRPTWQQDTWWKPTLHILYDQSDTRTLGDNWLPQTLRPTWQQDIWWQLALRRLYDLPDTWRLGDIRLSIYASPAVGARIDGTPLRSFAATSVLTSVANWNHNNGYDIY